MGNGKMPAILTVAVFAVLAAAVFWIQPYSADFPGRDFTRPARRFVTAALRQDSTTLVQLSGAPEPVAWALTVARRQPGRLSAGPVTPKSGSAPGRRTQPRYSS